MQGVTVDAADLLDLTDPAVIADPYPHYAALRAAAPVAWHSGLGVFVTSTHAAAFEVLRDRRLGRIFAPKDGADWDTFNWLHADSILDSEPPKHTRLRRLVSSAFTRGQIQRMAPRIAELTAGLLDECADRAAGPDGSFDVIADYAEPLPVLVIAELLGAPTADRVLLRDWSQAIVKMYEPGPSAEQLLAAKNAARDFAGYVEELAAHRAAHPGEDLLTALVQARDGSDRLSPTELIATAVLLLNAGHEASVNGFGNGLAALLGNRTALDAVSDQLDDDALIGTLVEEMLRFDSPLHLFERTASEDVEIGGVLIGAGQKIAALLGAANRDPAVFDRADEFDPTRDPNRHIAFGAGIHFCIGAPLARLELQISVRALLRRFGRLQIVAAEQRDTFVLRGFHSLTVAGDRP